MRPSCEALAEQAGVARWTTDLDEALADPQYTDLLRRPNHRSPRARPCKQGDCRRQAHLLRKAHGHQRSPTRWNSTGSRKQAGREERRGAGQALAAGPAEAEDAHATAASSAGSSPCAASSATGSSRATRSRAQRPSWNYRKEDGGGIILDMLCHLRYVLDNLFGDVRAVSCLGATHVDQALGRAAASRTTCTADDSAYATFELEGGIIAQINASWCVRVRRDDLFVLQVDGTKGSAVAGLRDCWMQPYAATPRPVWNPDVDSPINFYDGWQPVPESANYDNAFKAQWELFLRHVVKDEPFRWTLLEGRQGRATGRKGAESWRSRAWVDVPSLDS